MPIEELIINSSIDIISMRMQVREIAHSAGMSVTEQAIISMAVYLLANSMHWGCVGVPEGRIKIEISPPAQRRGITVHCYQKGLPITLPQIADFKKLVDEVSVINNQPDTLDVVLTLWAKR